VPEHGEAFASSPIPPHAWRHAARAVRPVSSGLKRLRELLAAAASVLAALAHSFFYSASHNFSALA